MEELNESEEKISVKSASLKYGLIYGLISIIMFIFLQVTKLDQSIIASILGFAVMIGALIWILNDFKKNNQGFMSFSEGFGLGMLVYLIGGTISGLFSILYMNVLDPSYVANKIAEARANMEQQNPNLTDEQIDFALSWSSYFMQPIPFFIVVMVFTLVIGAIVSLILAAILKKDNPEPYI